MKIFPVLITACIMLHLQEARAQFLIGDVINMTVTKVIKAIDLKVQRMQNKTIWLQNAQKVIENQMASAKLTEISAWSEKQQSLYSDYYSELWKIKSVISAYQRVKEMGAKQIALVRAYKRSLALFNRDSHFNPQELNYMQEVYKGILDASVKNMDDLILLVSPLKTQMTDGQRMELIDKAGDRLDEYYHDLQQFNTQGIRLSLGRSRDLNDALSIKRLYGIN